MVELIFLCWDISLQVLVDKYLLTWKSYSIIQFEDFVNSQGLFQWKVPFWEILFSQKFIFKFKIFKLFNIYPIFLLQRLHAKWWLHFLFGGLNHGYLSLINRVWDNGNFVLPKPMMLSDLFKVLAASTWMHIILNG